MIIDHTKKLTLAELDELDLPGIELRLSDASRKAIMDCRTYLERKLADLSTPIYGINTGFGSLHNVVIPPSQIEQLQENLVKSHACGMGAEVPAEIVRLMLLLKVRSLSYGKSGVQLATVERLCDMLNRSILPVVYQQGSLGASGDLAPLAHLSLPLIGAGEVYSGNEKMQAQQAFAIQQLEVLRLGAKEGLALLNGTQFMSAYAVHILLRARRLMRAADLIMTASLEAFDGRPEPFREHLHTIRPHPGQLETARAIMKHLNGSEIMRQPKQHVQDPYSFRCVPQVHGATRDTIEYAVSVVETEINSVTDNPTVFPHEDEILSGGNFHGQPLALVLDFAAIALAELASISERRTYLLISGQRGLPPFLTPNAGLNSGFMIPQYTAASIVSQNKQLCTPASVDSIVSSNGQEDHVSMGANAATKCLAVLENAERVLAIELMNASQALHFRTLQPAPAVADIISRFRQVVPVMESDQVLYEPMRIAANFVRSHRFA